MPNIQPKNAYDLLDKTFNEIQSLTDDIVTKILEHNGLSVDYVKDHPDEFCILYHPSYGLRDALENFVITHKGTVLGSYGILSQFDDNNMRMTCCIDYTLGGDS